MKRVSRFALVLLMVVPAAPGRLPAQEPDQPLTLREAVEMALKRNPEVLLAEEQVTEVQGKIGEVRAEAFPQLTLEGSGLRMRDPSVLNSGSFDNVPPEFRAALIPQAVNLFNLAVTVRQPIYTAGKVRNAIKLADQGKQEKEAGLEGARQRVTFKVFQAFHDLLLAQENQGVIRATYQQRQQHLEQARSRFSQGVATEIDVLRSQVNVANLEPELIRAENRVRMARSALNSLIMLDINAPTRIMGQLEFRPMPPPELSREQARALEIRPEVEVARHQVEEARLLLALAQAQNKLSVDMDAGWGHSAREPLNFMKNEYARWNLTFSFKLPFYDGGRKAGMLVQAQSRLRSAEHNLLQLQNSVRLEVKAACDELESSARAIEAARLSVTQAEKVLGMMQSNYQYGAATTLDVVDSQTAVAVSRNTQIVATYEYDMAKARLRLAQGAPILDVEETR
jgi:outer membrane protein